MRILVTGANGFIGKNLLMHLQAKEGFEVLPFTRDDSVDDLPSMLEEVDWVIHLAGVNRPQEDSEFDSGNVGLTESLCSAIKSVGKRLPVIYSSSIQAEQDNSYGRSKLAAEDCLLKLHKDTQNPVFIYRLPNVFGKWARPNYNSVVATFCHNIARDLPITVNDPNTLLKLVYVDDVVDSFMDTLGGREASTSYVDVSPIYEITLGGLVKQIKRFKESRENLTSEAVGTGLTRALYSTYVSYLTTNQFKYSVPKHADERGIFVEMLKTKESGQFSFFTAHPGVTRGGHYHHTKTEKFLVISGRARFRFKHIQSNEYYELETSGDKPEIVETVPGWTHDITNVGEGELICMLWANEIFDAGRPDTYACKID